MPALHALFCLRLWVFGLVFVRYKALEIRVLCFFVGNIFGDREKTVLLQVKWRSKVGVWKEKKAEHCDFWRREMKVKVKIKKI